MGAEAVTKPESNFQQCAHGSSGMGNPCAPQVAEAHKSGGIRVFRLSEFVRMQLREGDVSVPGGLFVFGADCPVQTGGLVCDAVLLH